LCHRTTAPSLIPLPDFLEYFVFLMAAIDYIANIGDRQRSLCNIR
jgi:hypothetical protein